MPLPEYNIYQNPSLGAHILWEFTKSYVENSNPKNYPLLILSFPVLPLCFNMRVVKGIRNRNFKTGSFYRAIEENKDLFSGLQERMEDMSDITMKSLFIATKSRLLIVDRDTMTLLPNHVPVPAILTKSMGGEYADILSSSRRFGRWFANLSVDELCLYFNINF
jgi:hypothetical protein